MLRRDQPLHERGIDGGLVGMQAAWQVLNDFKKRGTPALEEWAKGVKASPYGAVTLKDVTKAGRIREIEDLCLPEESKRDYENTWGHEAHFTKE